MRLQRGFLGHGWLNVVPCSFSQWWWSRPRDPLLGRWGVLGEVFCPHSRDCNDGCDRASPSNWKKKHSQCQEADPKLHDIRARRQVFERLIGVYCKEGSKKGDMYLELPSCLGPIVKHLRTSKRCGRGRHVLAKILFRGGFSCCCLCRSGCWLQASLHTRGAHS